MKRICLIVSLFLTGHLVFGQDYAIPKCVQIDELEPALPAYLLNETNIDEIPFEAFKGKVVALEFWATSCKPCIPALEHLALLPSENRSRFYCFGGHKRKSTFPFNEKAYIFTNCFR